MDDKLDCRFCKHHCQKYEYGNGDAEQNAVHRKSEIVQIVTCMIDNRIVNPTEAPKKCKDKKIYSRLPKHKEYTVTIKIDHNISDFESCMLNGGLRFGRANKQTLVEHVLNRCFSAGVHEFNIDVDYEILDIDGEPKEQIVRTVKKPLLYKVESIFGNKCGIPLFELYPNLKKICNQDGYYEVTGNADFKKLVDHTAKHGSVRCDAWEVKGILMTGYQFEIPTLQIVDWFFD